MNSKERVKATIERKAVDKIPLGFYLVDHDTIAKVIGRPTYVRNNPAKQIAFWEGRRDEVVESMKEDISLKIRPERLMIPLMRMKRVMYIKSPLNPIVLTLSMMRKDLRNYQHIQKRCLRTGHCLMNLIQPVSSS